MSSRARIRSRILASTASAVDGLRSREGIVGRVARALDDELSVKYLIARLEREDELIDRYVARRPKSRELVSIVVPVFGIPLVYLKELVQSIDAQTYAHWELCLCDDGDESQEVRRFLEKLSRRDPRYKVHRHAKNLGIAAATRSATRLAAGTLLAFVDEDDLLHPRALEAVAAAFAEDPDLELVYTDNDHATDLGHRRAPLRKPGWSPELLQCVNYVNHLVVARRALLERGPDLFGPATSGGQDWELGLFAAEQARGVGHVPLPLYHWRKRPGSLAAGLGAKPWVRDACVRVRSAHLSRIDPRLTLSRADDRDASSHHLEPDFVEGSALSRLSVVVLDAPSHSQHKQWLVEWAGWQCVEHARTGDTPTNRALLGVLAAQWSKVAGECVLVVDGRRPPPIGNAARSLAFAVQPKVGCVWPFFDRDQRLSYTMAGEQTLAQAPAPASVLSRFSGNVLTGPAHGLHARRELLEAVTELVLDRGPPSFLDAPRDLDATFATLGLAARELGFRNVACRGMRAPIDLPKVSVPAEWLPSRDPYV